MGHELSLACYQDAVRNAMVHAWQYADLEALLQRFGVLEHNIAAIPDRFAFSGPVPQLLIVEDEVDLANLTKELLVQRGYPESAIVIQATGESAIDYVQSQRVDIALVDIKLGESGFGQRVYLSGLHVMRAIRDTSPKAKVFITSGFVTYQMVHQAIFEMGASYCLRKPYKRDDLLQVTQWAIDSLSGHANVLSTPAPTGEPVAGRILVVDDDRDVAQSLMDVLTEHGYDVEAAFCGLEALQKISEASFDAVILDIYMADLDGLEVLKRMRQRGDSSKVLILTALHDETIADRAMALGADDFLTKPYDAFQVHLKLEYVLANA